MANSWEPPAAGAPRYFPESKGAAEPLSDLPPPVPGTSQDLTDRTAADAAPTGTASVGDYPLGSGSSGGSRGRGERRRRVLLGAVVGVVVLALSSGVGYLLFGRDTGEPLATDTAGGTNASEQSDDAGATVAEETDLSTVGSADGQQVVERPSDDAVFIAGLEQGAQFSAGEVVEVVPMGARDDTEVLLFVDGREVDRGFGDEVLTWQSVSGRHSLTLGLAESGALSEPVLVQVADAARSEPLVPVSASATREREPVERLRCGGSNSFEAELLIDGDPNTGWGADRGDGSGATVTIDFGQMVTVTRVGLSPGYLRVAPRSSNGCRPTQAFSHNRFVERVEYRFDDGSIVIQDFVQEATVQEMSVTPVSTRRVAITILSTRRQVEDDDTVLSDAVFYGYRT